MHRGRDFDDLWQAIALRDVKHVVIAEHRFSGYHRPFFLVRLFRLHALPEDHQVPLFPLSDASAPLLELVEGEEVVLGVACGAKEPGIDAGVVALGNEILRMAGLRPRLFPGNDIAFQLLDDAVGDDLVDV